MTTKLQSYARGRWFTGEGEGETILNAVNGEPVAVLTTQGLDFSAMLDYGRTVGGPALRKLTFHERALRLKALAQYLLERKETYYELSKATGATRNDSWIDIEGGIGTLFTYSSKGRRELPNETFLLDGAPEMLSKQGTFVGVHLCTPLQGVAVHINAFNFPCWGMLEKISVTLLAGVPAIVKPASQTAFVTELMFRDIIASGTFPEGSLQLICGSTGDLLQHLGPQDAVTFTGSASTALKLRQMPSILRNSVRFTTEADSLNFSLLGPDATPQTPEFDLFVKEVAREMTAKAGQKCTAIRRAFAPREQMPAVIDAISARLKKVVLGDPSTEGVTMGALASLGQRDEVRERVQELCNSGAELVFGDPHNFEVKNADIVAGAFLGPLLLHTPQPKQHAAAHQIEAFGPVATLMPYDSVEDAIELVKMGEGSLVGSVFTYDNNFARNLVLGVAAYHGRLLIVNRDCAKESTGHGSPLPSLVHGGPGRAGGGEEMGGIRGVMHYLQRTALQGSPETLTQIGQRWIKGANQHQDIHPFRKSLEELELGDCVISAPRTVTLEDIEHFAEFTGDKFYAHMDEEAAKANPFFGGRVAHGYYILSIAAGLFVDPAPGPVLANYGIDTLRFLAPVFPGDTLRVTLTCKQKNPRVTENYGEVRWDAAVTNQDNTLVAQYDVLTMVRKHHAPEDAPDRACLTRHGRCRRMTYENILFSIDSGIARLTLNRPDKLNSFNTAMHEEVREALSELKANTTVRVLLLTGAGRGFCAGQDLSDRAVAPGDKPTDLGASIERYYAPMVLALRALPLPVVCAVNGVAAGAGVSLAVACDLVIAKKSASFIQSFAKVGLMPDTGGSYFLPRLVGTARAMGLAMLGEKLSAQQAADWGLIWRCVDDEAFDEHVEALLKQLAAAPTCGLAATKQAIYASGNATLEQQLQPRARRHARAWLQRGLPRRRRSLPQQTRPGVPWPVVRIGQRCHAQ